MNIHKDLMELSENMKGGKRFRLLKDLPGMKAGEIFAQSKRDPLQVIPEKIVLHGGMYSACHTFNLYCVEDEYQDFFEPVK